MPTSAFTCSATKDVKKRPPAPSHLALEEFLWLYSPREGFVKVTQKDWDETPGQRIYDPDIPIHSKLPEILKPPSQNSKAALTLLRLDMMDQGPLTYGVEGHILNPVTVLKDAPRTTRGSQSKACTWEAGVRCSRTRWVPHKAPEAGRPGGDFQQGRKPNR